MGSSAKISDDFYAPVYGDMAHYLTWQSDPKHRIRVYGDVRGGIEWQLNFLGRDIADGVRSQVRSQLELGDEEAEEDAV